MKPLLHVLVFSAWSVGVIGIACAQKDASLSDPTRPPVTASEPVTSGAENAPPPSGLQMIILSKDHKPKAVINGIMVELGGKVGEATLVMVNESEVVIQGPAGREVLQLLPGAVKKFENSRAKKDDGVKHGK